MKDLLKILFVEDVLNDAELTWMELEKNKIPFEKLLVDNKEDFLKGLKSFSPDIILSDYSLPQFNGMTALSLRNEHNPLVPFLLVTASINEEIAIECMKAGADDYIIKGNLSRLAPAIVNSINKFNSLKDKKIAEDTLRESERKLREAQSIGRIGSWEFDVESNTITWSDQTYKLYKRDPAIGPPSVDEEAEYYSEEHREKLRIFAEQAIKNGKQFQYDFEVRLPEGEIVYFYSKMQPVLNAEGRVIKLAGVVQDITERKLNEQLIAKASADWNKTFDSIQDAIILLDMDQKIVRGNKAFLEIIDEDEVTLTNNNCFGNVHHTACPIEGCPFIRMKISRMRESIDLRLHEKYFRVIVDPIFNDLKELTGAVHIMSDITSLKNTEQALTESESIFRSLIEKIPDGVYKTTHSGKVLEVNPALVRILGFDSKEELLGVDIGLDLYFDPSDRKKMTIEGMNNELISYRLRRKDGSEVWVEDHGWYTFNEKNEIVYHEGVLRDVTERRVSEAKIRTLGKAIEQCPVSILITDTDGKIEFVNDEFVLRTQYNLSEVKGKYPRIFNPGHLPQNEYDSMWESLHKGNIWRGEFTNRRKDGTIYPEEVTISVMHNPDKSIANYILILVDITDKKKNLNDLIIAKDKAEEGDRLKTAFLHNISHEIRTPMNAIVGFSTLLNEPDIDNQTRHSYSELIMQSSNQLLSIVTDIVDISNIDAGVIKKTETIVNIKSIISSLYSQFLPVTGLKKLKLTCNVQLSETESIVYTDVTKLTQILTNLINNALKFTDAGEINISCIRKGVNLEFCISDTGIGIPEEFHSKIFDRFYQVQSNMSRLNEGTGLGLAISQAYVDLLGGTIWVESVPGTCTKFYFTLPYKNTGFINEYLGEPVKQEEKRHWNSKTILIAEDIESNFKLLTYFLGSSGIGILRAENGSEAVQKCMSGAKIDIILMDIRMPVMDGYAATKIIKESFPDLPVIAQTAYTDDLSRVKEHGFDGFIPKPFSKQNLLSVIKEFL